MKVKIKERTGADLFFYLDMVEEHKDRASEWAVTEFVEFDGEPATLEKFLSLTGEQQAILTGRVFSLNVKGVKQDNENLYYKDYKFVRKAIPHNVIEKFQLRMQKLKDKGETSTTSMMKSAIETFYDLKIESLEKVDYVVAAVMFNTVNSFLTKATESSNEFDFDD